MALVVCPRQTDLRADAVVLVLFLEFVDFALQALLGEAEGINHFVELGDTTNHLGTADNKFADCIHHAIETAKGNADRFRGGGLLLSLDGCWFQGGFWRRGASLLWLFRNNWLRRRFFLFDVDWGVLRDAAQK